MRLQNYLFAFLILFFGQHSFAQLTFQRAIGTPGNDRNYSLDKTKDGGYITAGYTENFSGTLDIYVAKLDPYGNIEWTRTIGNSNSQRAWKVLADQSGGYLLAGSTTQAGSKDRAFLIKLNPIGQIVWQRFLEDTEDLAFYGMHETFNGNILLTGLRKTNPGNFDLLVAKFYPNGNLAFAQAYEHTGNQEGFNIIQDANGHYVATGWFSSSATSNVQTAMIVKLDTNGNHLFTLTNGIQINASPSAIRGYDLIQMGTHYYVAGWAQNATINKVDTNFAVAVATNGNFPNGNTVYTASTAQNIFEIKKALDNNLIVAGYTNSGFFGGRDAWMMKMTPNGQHLWSRNYGGSAVDGHWPTEVVIEPDKTFTLLSSTNTFGQASSYDFYLVKTDFDGRSACNTQVLTTTMSVDNAVTAQFFQPLSLFSATLTSVSFADTFRNGDVQKLCCSMKAITAGSMNVCIGSTLPLGFDSLEGYHYKWFKDGLEFSNQANPRFTVEPGFTNATFKLRVFTTDNTCGPDSSSFTFTLNPKPARTFVRSKRICAGDSFFVSAPFPSSNITWTGPGLTSNASSLFIKNPGDYVLSFRSGACQYTDTITLSINPLPLLSIKDTAVCAGELVVIQLPATWVSYNWNNSGPSNDNIKSFLLPGFQTLEVIDTNGCLKRDTFEIVHYQLPPAFSIQSQADSLCENEQRVITGPLYPNHTYSWNNGESTSRSFIANPNQSYVLRITNSNQCERSDSIFIPAKDTLSVLGIGTRGLCWGDVFEINRETGVRYFWNDVEGDTFYLPQGMFDTVKLSRIAPNSCVSHEFIHFEVYPLPSFSLGSDTTICDTAFLDLFGPEGMTSYSWSTGAITSSIRAIQEGTYRLLVTDVNGCSFQDSLFLTMVPCETGSVRFTALDKLRLHPNPSSGRVYVEFPHPLTSPVLTPIYLLSASGQRFELAPSLQSGSNSLILDLHTFSSGVYFLQMEGYATSKLILVKE